MRRLVMIAGIAALTLAGCSGEPTETDPFMEGLRAVFPNDTDAVIVSLAESVCELVAAGVESGLSNADAVDLVYVTLLDEGMPEADALRVTVTSVGGWCPMDIRE